MLSVPPVRLSKYFDCGFHFQLLLSFTSMEEVWPTLYIMEVPIFFLLVPFRFRSKSLIPLWTRTPLLLSYSPFKLSSSDSKLSVLS